MKTKLLTISFFIALIILVGCDSAENKKEGGSLIDSVEGLNFAETETFYVLAENGLRMRDEPELDAEKVAIIKYGSKVQAIPTDAHEIKPVNGLFGDMVKCTQGADKGYMFDAYLSSLPVPEEGQDEEEYVEMLQKENYPAKYDYVGTEDGMEAEEIVTIPARNLQEAFLIGQRMDIYNFDFDLPSSNSRELTFRNEKGETKSAGLRQDDSDLDLSFIYEELDNHYWFREVGFQFDGRQINFIKVDAAYEGGSWSCTLGKEGEAYVFRKYSVAD